MAPRPVALARALVTTFVLAAAMPAAASAVSIQHDSTAITVPGSDHGDTIWPGDDVHLVPTIENTDGDQATGVGGTLTSQSSGATVTQSAATFPDLTFGAPEASTAPYGVHVAADTECGVNLPFGLGVGYNGGSGSADFSVPTGSTGPQTPFDATDLPRAIPDGQGSATSTITIGQAGRVKALQIRIARIDHTNTGDLQIDLVAPDGTSVRLKNANLSQAGTDVRDLVFSDSAATSINSASAPFTGTYRPVESLSVLEGHLLTGGWRVKVSDISSQNTGSFEAWGMDVSKAVCTDGPLPGLVATPNPAQPGQSVTLDASSSLDPGATIAKYEFDLGDGNGFSVDNGSDPTLDHLFPAGGHDVKVRITDDYAGPGGPRSVTSAPVHVSVGSRPNAALAATPVSPHTGETVTFDASGSTVSEGGAITSYEWDFDGDGAFERTTQTPTTTFAYAKSGTVTPHVRVTNDIGATDTAGLDAPVVVQDRPPVASFSNAPVLTVGTGRTFTSTSTDADDNVAHYTWTVTPGSGAGAGVIASGQDSPTVSVDFASPGGSYLVSLVVTDDAGESSAPATKTVVVTRPPTASFVATPAVVTPDTPVAFDGTGSSDPDGPISAWAWDFDNDGTFDATGAHATFTGGFAGIGSHVVKLRVTDAAGATAETTRTVVVKNDPPVAALSADPNPVLAGVPVTLSAAGSTDDDGSVTAYDWDLDGNGSYESTKPASFVTVFSAPGTQRIGVRVHDDHGATDTAVLDLVVSAPSTGGGGGGGGPTGGSTSTGGGLGTGGTKPVTGTKGPTGPTTGPAGATGATGGRLVATLLGTVRQRAKTVRRAGFKLCCRSTRAGRCLVVARISAKDARKLGLKVRGKKPVSIGQVRMSVRAGRTKAMALKLNRSGRKALASKKLRRVSVRLSALVTDARGGKARASRVLLVRR